MRHRTLLTLLVVALAAFVVVAKDTVKGISISGEAKSESEVRDDADSRRYLKAATDSFGPATEERGISIKMPSFNGIKSLFSKTSNLGAGMKHSPEVATALKNPKVNQAFKEVVKQPGIVQSFRNNLKLNSLASLLRRRPAQFTSRQVTNVGHLAAKTSSSRTFGQMWNKYGAAFLFVVGIIFLFTMVYKASQPGLENDLLFFLHKLVNRTKSN
ncbi:hypothetical protein GN244_ATG02097 [Phytophthora infestans]|uniref:Secreted RxLR effector peptide protein n=1 Tax=Phytophthora infestans TaxID=4787 RepID=A0A833TKU7_PHYIN|nr:hypothetical protein GN244_ATG02097 [Phytophthora infestans]